MNPFFPKYFARLIRIMTLMMLMHSRPDLHLEKRKKRKEMNMKIRHLSVAYDYDIDNYKMVYNYKNGRKK